MRKKIPALCNLALVFKKGNASIWPWSVKYVMIYTAYKAEGCQNNEALILKQNMICIWYH